MPGFGRGGGIDRNPTPELLDALTRLLEAFREGTGGKAQPIVDLNFNLTTEGIVRVARALEPFDLAWLEVDSYDAAALAHARRRSPIPLCSGENLYTLRGFRPYLEAGAMDVASVDVIWNGFAQSLKIAALAETHEVACAPHNYYSHLATFIAAQWCAAIPNVRLLEIDVDDVPWREELTTAAPEIRDGELVVPAGPGWGCDVVEDVLRAHPRRRDPLPRPRSRAAVAAVALVALALLVRALVGDRTSASTRCSSLPAGSSLLPFSRRSSTRLVGAGRRHAGPGPRVVRGAAHDRLDRRRPARRRSRSRSRWPPSSCRSPSASTALRRRSERDPAASRRRELLTLLALAAIVAFALASSWDIAYPFQPRGTDWGHYLLYADEVAAQGAPPDRRSARGRGRPGLRRPARVGAIYGSVLLLDGVSSWSLTVGIVVVSALSVLSVYAAAAVLWGTGAGLVAAGAYAVAPDPARSGVLARSRDGARDGVRARSWSCRSGCCSAARAVGGTCSSSPWGWSASPPRTRRARSSSRLVLVAACSSTWPSGSSQAGGDRERALRGWWSERDRAAARVRGRGLACVLGAGVIGAPLAPGPRARQRR